jgi:hypothetical protein
MRSYETDYAGWAEDQSAAIRVRRWSDLDEVALADEVGNLVRAVAKATTDEQRLRIRKILENRPTHMHWAFES